MPRRVLNDEVLRIIKELRDRGYGYKKIRKYLKEKYGLEASNSALHYWIRIKLGDENVARSEIPWEPRRCPELAYIIGVTLGDGSVGIIKRYSKGSRRYVFSLKVRDQEFAEAVKKAIERLGLHCSIRKRYMRRKEAVYYEVYCCVKRFVVFLKDIKDHPEKAWQWIREYEKEFLKGFYESEGNLSIEGYIRIYNKRREYIDMIVKCLQRLGIRCSISYDKSNKYWILYVPACETRRFLAMVKPIIKYSRDDPHYQRVKKEREERRRRNKSPKATPSPHLYMQDLS
ncbi:MAG: hypothetical protein DRN15_02675 [Thermoprotei archaeon]|nr:MAG: hypothetical protein DRM97_06980 [Thermoprotei archaeon]RLF24575.1 MAG: hypothetical protein DRN15_02675 [Thermoprotei archaeon]